MVFTALLAVQTAFCEQSAEISGGGDVGERDQVLREIQAERAAGAAELRTALEKASGPGERAALAAAFAEADVAKRIELEKLAIKEAPGQPVPIAKRVEGIASGKARSAMIERYRAQDELAALREETQGMAPAERAARYTQWQETNGEVLQRTAEILEAEARKEVADLPQGIPAQPPESLDQRGKAAWNERSRLTGDLSALRERTASMSPEERSQIYAQWMTQNAGKLEEAGEALRKQANEQPPREALNP